jgi:SAM-dependent methyltransferase
MAGDNPAATKAVEPYSVLAVGYDVVMEHVDYDAWAAYVYELIETFRPESRTVLELGCGTGSFGLALQPRGGYDYLATDRSETMLKVARTKASERDTPLRFASADFTDFDFENAFDVVILLYDGLNYLLDTREIRRMFGQVEDVLTDDGLFIFDQSTPVNSANNEEYFEDEGQVDEFSYVRRSWYDPQTCHHTTRFDITVYGQTYREEHVQRAYTRSEIQDLIASTGFTVEGGFAGLSRQSATDRAERIHWVLRKDSR